MLSLKQLHDVCLATDPNGGCCRYLHEESSSPGTYVCLKMTGKAQQIDKEISDYLSRCKKSGRDPYEDGVPLGDNCEGYPLLRNIEQGYDKD
jgi:hypothetical protein